MCDNSNIFKFSPNNEKQELRIKISSSEKIKSDLIIGSNEFSLNEENHYQVDLIIDNDNEDNIMKLYELVDIAFEQKSFSNNFIQPFKCLGNSGIKGIQYYNITFTKSLSLMVTNEKFHFKDYFVFANNEKEIDFLDEKKFKVISNEFSHNSLVYYFDEPFYYFLYSFYDNNRYIEFSKIQISEIETKLDLLIKNMIIDDEMITNKIEAYWILKKLGNIQIE